MRLIEAKLKRKDVYAVHDFLRGYHMLFECGSGPRPGGSKRAGTRAHRSRRTHGC